MGNPDFAVPSLEMMSESGHVIDAVVTGTDKRRGRGGKKSPSPVKTCALNLGIPVIEADNMRSPEFAEKLQQLRPDLLVVVAYKLLPPQVLAIPELGSLNLHASLLPRYRGAAPIHHALINGEKETGCTVFLLDQGMDTGMILNQEATEIGLLETTGDVYDRLKVTGARLLAATVDQLSEGSHEPREQDERYSSKAPKINAEDARIDFSKDADTVHNLIRGMSPFPGSWTRAGGRKVKILRSAPKPGQRLEPGHALLVDGVALAGCGSGSVILHEVQPEGKKRVDGVDFLNSLGGSAVFSSEEDGFSDA
ncbi:methionyl-tRNA formyltransferase [Balneolales bacterium ANBcel1]|nr:methionyl-tRNA formyltransferase [Balneolales bacterium ANBcel1]